MPVTTTHREYDENAARWQLMRDVIGGEDKVKAATTAYLPKPAGRSDDEFKNYVMRAQFFDATGKTAAGMLGGIFRKPPISNLPPEVEYLLDDADGKGTSLGQLAKDACGEVINLGRVGLLVDMPDVKVEKRLDEERELGAQARLYAYSAESIINWAYERVGSSYRLSLVVLKEMIDREKEDDEFDSEEIETYRVLELERDDGGAAVGYRVRVFEQDADEHWGETQSYRPTLPGGDRMDFIPFAFIGASDNTASVDKPPLLDVANVNIGHYRNSADYEDAIYMVGQPTPVITGLDKQFIEKHVGQFVIGSRTAWMLPKDSSATMLESDRDLGALANAMERKEGQMIQLGARLIDSNPAGVEAAETIRLRQSGEASVLASTAENLSRGFLKAIQWAAEWMKGNPDAVEFDTNADFFPQRLTSADLKELVAAWQGGVLTYETLFENLVAGEIITAGTDPEEYEAQLEEAAATAMAALPTAIEEAEEEDEEDEEDDEDEDEDEEEDDAAA